MADPVVGVIGIPCRVQGRWSPFWECLLRLERPENVWIEPNYDNSVAKSRNLITEKALKMGAEWIFWLDDDQMFTPDVLTKILRRPEAIVIGLTLMRMKMGHGYKPIWSDRELWVRDGDPIWTPIDEIQTNADGLMRLCSGTCGGVLTRTEIFSKIPSPWWQMGQHVPDMFWEDVYFYEAARKAGYEIWGDPSVRFGHMSDLTVWPHQQDDGTFSTVLADGFQGFLSMPWVTKVTA